MGKSPAFQFYPGDWRRDTELHMMGFISRGVWVEMLCCMFDSKERGKLEGTIDQLSRLIGCTVSEMEQTIKDLKRTETADVTNCNGECNEIVTVINRRMYKEEKARKLTSNRVQRCRIKKMKRMSNGDVTLPSSSSSSKERKKKESFSPFSNQKTLTQQANNCFSKCSGNCASSWKGSSTNPSGCKDSPGETCHWCQKFEKVREKMK